ncbi:MAG: hypothetical protein L0J18_12925, partial [Tetragenococcus koreensis]|nr:hypothetical protein [Tetragenococcus koreensis]MDN6391972.1 hypothetical protein [Lactococcus lactis]
YPFSALHSSESISNNCMAGKTTIAFNKTGNGDTMAIKATIKSLLLVLNFMFYPPKKLAI